MHIAKFMREKWAGNVRLGQSKLDAIARAGVSPMAMAPSDPVYNTVMQHHDALRCYPSIHDDIQEQEPMTIDRYGVPMYRAFEESEEAFRARELEEKDHLNARYGALSDHGALGPSSEPPHVADTLLNPEELSLADILAEDFKPGPIAYVVTIMYDGEEHKPIRVNYGSREAAEAGGAVLKASGRYRYFSIRRLI